MKEFRQSLELLSRPRRVELSGMVLGYVADPAFLEEMLELGIGAGRLFVELNRRGDPARVQEGLSFWASWLDVLDLSFRRAYGEAVVMGSPAPELSAAVRRHLLELLFHLLSLTSAAGPALLEQNQRALASYLLLYGGAVERAALQTRMQGASLAIWKVAEAALLEAAQIQARSGEVEQGARILEEWGRS